MWRGQKRKKKLGGVKFMEKENVEQGCGMGKLVWNFK